MTVDILRGIRKRLTEPSVYPKDTAYWTMAALNQGSTDVVIQSRVKRGSEDFGPRVSRLYRDGLEHLRTEARTPAMFNQDSVKLVLDKCVSLAETV